MDPSGPPPPVPESKKEKKPAAATVAASKIVPEAPKAPGEQVIYGIQREPMVAQKILNNFNHL